MQFEGIKIGFGLTGSHCTLERTLKVAKVLVEDGADLYPVFSPAVETTNTRFGTAASWQQAMGKLAAHPIISTIAAAEPIGPQKLLDVMVIAPCSGNTIAKLANGIVDTPVLMAAKAHLRNKRPLVLAVSTNDGLGMNGKNIGLLLNIKNIYWVPFGQDDPINKENSLVANMELLPATIAAALKYQQIQPILIEYSPEV